MNVFFKSFSILFCFINITACTLTSSYKFKSQYQEHKKMQCKTQQVINIIFESKEYILTFGLGEDEIKNEIDLIASRYCIQINWINITSKNIKTDVTQNAFRLSFKYEHGITRKVTFLSVFHVLTLTLVPAHFEHQFSMILLLPNGESYSSITRYESWDQLFLSLNIFRQNFAHAYIDATKNMFEEIMIDFTNKNAKKVPVH